MDDVLDGCVRATSTARAAIASAARAIRRREYADGARREVTRKKEASPPALSRRAQWEQDRANDPILAQPRCEPPNQKSAATIMSNPTQPTTQKAVRNPAADISMQDLGPTPVSLRDPFWHPS